jgi:predicted ATP-grasp superfamily ATP-dependent carboligase
VVSVEAIVLDANQRSSLAVVRSLGRLGVPITTADRAPLALASASRYSRTALQYPDPGHDPAGFRAFLEELNEQRAGAVLIPTTDGTVAQCLQERERIPNLRLPFPSAAAYESMSDKYALYERCQALKIEVPRTVIIRPDTDRAELTRFARYPVVVKPRWSTTAVAGRILRQAVAYAADMSELAALVRRFLAEGAPSLLLQQYVVGEGRGVFGLYEHGRLISAFAHRRLRERPPSGGVSVLSESVPLDAAMLEAMDRLLAPLDWHGVAMAEFKFTPLGRPILIEINARFWGSLQLSVDAGCNFPAMLYRLAIDAPVAPRRSYRVGRRLRWYLGDVDHTYLLLKQGGVSLQRSGRIRAIARLLRPWQPRGHSETFRLGDPRPFCHELAQYLGVH